MVIYAIRKMINFCNKKAAGASNEAPAALPLFKVCDIRRNLIGLDKVIYIPQRFLAAALQTVLI